MNLYTLPVGPFEVNCYLAVQADGAAVLFDPGSDADAIRSWIEERKARVQAILVTHGHMDHISALARISEMISAPLYMHPADTRWAFGHNNHMPPYYGIPKEPTSAIQPVHESEVIRVAGLDIHVIETPGHTPGGVCYYMPASGMLISGDTLFQNSVGRTDLPGASNRVLSESLKKLAALPPTVRVYPGHGDPTTIGDEIKNNYFMITAARAVSRKA